MSTCSTSDRISLNTGSVWRTSTPEPTDNGIIWTYVKDVTRYIPLFAKSGSFILELDNLLQGRLNGQYASMYTSQFEYQFYDHLSTATLFATFYTASQKYPTAGQSNLIVPISTMSNSSADDASVPPAFSVSRNFPYCVVTVLIPISAERHTSKEHSGDLR